MADTLDRIIYRLAVRAAHQSGQVALTSVSGRSDQWHASFHRARQHKIEVHGKTPVETLLSLEAALDDRGVP
jgi:hypothetical protein